MNRKIVLLVVCFFGLAFVWASGPLRGQEEDESVLDDTEDVAINQRLEIALDIPCGTTTTLRRIQSPWGVGYYQLRALRIVQVGGSSPITTDVTAQATWQSSNPAFGGFSSPPGFFRGSQGGTTVVRATHGGFTSDPFYIELPDGMSFPGPAGTGGCSQPNGGPDPALGNSINAVVTALQNRGAWPVEPSPPSVSPPSWLPTHPWHRVWFVEAGSGSGGVRVPHPHEQVFYRSGLSVEEAEENAGDELVYLRGNRSAVVVGVDAASAYRLGELVDANGALIFPPDLSFYEVLAAIWCAWCRNEGCSQSEGGGACSEEEEPGPEIVWSYVMNAGYTN